MSSFANLRVMAYRVFRRARLGLTYGDMAEELEGLRGLVALYDREGRLVTSRDYKLSEGDLIVVAAPTEREAVRAVERLNKLFTLAERVYTALEARKPPGG